MRTYILSGAIALGLCVPVFVRAEVIINEIAWMGTAVSATDEWVELFNTGSEDVPLSGWKLTADDGAPAVSLSGSIPSGGYYLLERTDDSTVSDITADTIYSGDLGNGGETLKLFDTNGVVVDTVVGDSEWSALGGNNTTKDTPQRQPDSTWLTGIPTPRALNTTIASTPPSEGEVAGASTNTTTSARKRVVTGGYKQVVFGYAGEDMVGVTGAALRFEGYAVSDKNIRLNGAEYHWSFGDGGHAKGKKATHAYEEPGTYLATLRVFGTYQKWQDRIMVTILPAGISLKEARAGERGFIEVHNDTDTELDLSGWRLGVLYARGRLRDTAFVIPEGTLIAPRTSVRFSSRITKLVFADVDTVVLHYPSGARVKQSTDDASATSTAPVAS